eukprot:scaffold2042_cov175-Ochromonas_danica.AAC.7
MASLEDNWGLLMFVTTIAAYKFLPRLGRTCVQSCSRGAGACLAASSFSTEAVAESGSASGATSATGRRNRKSPIYTRTGDKGIGERRPKSDLIFHALGNQDELNASIGIAIEHCLEKNNNLSEMLIEIQSRLFDLGAAVATPLTCGNEKKVNYTRFPAEFTNQLEQWIDEIDSQLVPLNYFILPSGGLSSAHLHLSRTICRRAERSVVELIEDNIVDAEVGRYLNRLSDFLFVAARKAAAHEDKKETPWRKVPLPASSSSSSSNNSSNDSNI